MYLQPASPQRQNPEQAGLITETPKIRMANKAEKIENIFMSNILTTAKIGFEFTFECDPHQSTRWNSGNWTSFIKNDEAITPSLEEKYMAFVQELEGRLGAQNEGAEKNGKFGEPIYQLTFPDATQPFWITTSLDPGVIEIQTQPAAFSEITGPLRQNFDSLFAALTELGFRAGDGGGHINVDYETGFNNNFLLAVNTLIATEERYRELHDGATRYAPLIDSGNDKKDPFLSTPRIQATKAPCESWGEEPSQNNREDRFPSWFSHVGSNVRHPGHFRQQHAAWLFQYPTWTQFQHDVSKQFGPYVNSMDYALHYQAINIEHLFEEDKSVRRMEFRFFKSQKDMHDVEEGLRLIDELVAMAERKLRP